MAIDRIVNDVVHEGRVIFQIPPTILSSKFKATDTTPTITTALIYQASGASITITRFIGGFENQTIRILGDGTTTIQDNASIVLGANLLLLANKFYCFTLFNGVWYPDA